MAVKHQITAAPAKPPQRLARMGSTSLRHAGRIFEMAFSPDNKVMATAGQTGVVRLWHVKTGRLVRELDTGGDAVDMVLFTADGQHLLVSSRSSQRGQSINTAMVFDRATGNKPRQFPLPDTTFFGIRFSRDGRFVVAPDKNERAAKPFHVRVWDMRTGRRLAKHLVQEKSMRFVALSADGRRFCLQSKSGDLRVQDSLSGRVISRMHGPNSSARAVAFSADGKHVAAAGQGRVQVWRVNSSREVARFKTGVQYYFRLRFGTADKTVVVNNDKVVEIYELSTKKRLRCIQVGEFHGTRFSLTYDGRIMAVWNFGEVTARLWNLHTGKEITPTEFHGHRASGGLPSFSPDGRKIVVMDDLGKGRVWDVVTGKRLARLQGKTEGNVKPAIFIDKGRKILAADYPNNIHEWDAVTGKRLRTWRAFRGVNGLVFSPQQDHVAMTHWGRRLAIWHAGKAKLVKDFAVPEARADVLRYSADGRFFAVACSDDENKGKTYTYYGVVRLWDLTRGKEVRVWHGFKGHLFCMDLSADGRMVAAAGAEDRSVHLLEIATGKERGKIGPVSHRPGLATFSPDGRLLAFGTHMGLELWDVATGKRLWRPQPLLWSTGMPRFSPDGRVLAVSWTDGLVETWKMPSLPKADDLSEAEVTACWQKLAGDDAKSAWQAICRLSLAPKSTLPFLKKHLQPLQRTKTQHTEIARWIADLNHRRFPVRAKAMAELRKTGEVTRPQLKTALAQPALSLETHQRLLQLLGELEKTPRGETLRAFRALEVLEKIKTAEARGLVQRLTTGVAGARLTEEAERCLRRWIG